MMPAAVAGTAKYDFNTGASKVKILRYFLKMFP